MKFIIRLICLSLAIGLLMIVWALTKNLLGNYHIMIMSILGFVFGSYAQIIAFDIIYAFGLEK